MKCPHFLAYGILLSLSLSLSGSGQQVRESPGFLRRAVNQAKAKGEPAVQCHNFPEYPLYKSLDHALTFLTHFLLQITGKPVAGLAVDESQLWTWYRADILRNLTHHPLFRRVYPAPDLAIPPTLTTLSDNSMLLRNSGGKLTVDGVVVTCNETPLPLEDGQVYLVFLRFIEPRNSGPTRIGVLDAGPSGIFSYNSSTDTITPLSHSLDAFASQVLAFSGGTLSGLTKFLPNSPQQ